MPKERGWWRNGRNLPKRANGCKRNKQWNQPEPRAHSQQNKAKTPWTAGSYQMYPGHRVEEPKGETRRLMECQPGTTPYTTLGSLTLKTVPQPMRPEPDLETSPEAEPGKMTDDGKSMDKAVLQNPVLFRTTLSSQREEP